MLRQRSFSVVAALTVIAGIRNAVAGSCEEVWFVEGSFLGDTFTCGDRIVYLQTPQGGGKTEQEARVQASLEELKCADCWPWEKYRQDGETERSPKRGIAIENNRLTSEALSGLSQVISWGVTWDYKLEGTDGPDLSVWKMAGVDFVPLIWGAGTIELAEANGLPDGSKALLGFNEPNFPNQANLDPYTAARHWKDIEQLAEDNDISTIVSPSMNYHESMDPIEWLEQFLAYCEGCKVDAIGIHVFTCYAGGLKYHLDRYRALGKPMWVTEIACSDWQSPERLSAEGQMAYMKEAIPLLEADEDVERYAWFSYFKDEWAHPIVDGENGDAGLVHPNGTLTPLGQLYNTFASGTNLTEINITEPENTTSSTTSTAFRGPMTTSVSTSTPTTTGSHTTSGTSSTSRSFTGTGTTSASTITATISPSATATSTGSSTFTETSKTLTTTTTGTSTTPSSTTFASSTLAVTAVTSTATRISTTQTTRVKAATTAASPTGTTSSSVLTDTWSTSSSKPSELVETASTTGGTSGTGTMMSSASSASTTPSPVTTQGSMLTSSTNEGPSTSTDEENVTNETEPAIEVLSCTQAVDAWCHSDPSSAPFFPLQQCPDWRLHDAMCSSPSVANNAPQFAGTTELEKGSFPALFLLLAVLGAAMAGAVLASLFYRQKGHYILCCRRQKEDPEDLKRAISGKLDWQGNAFLPVLCNTGASARVAPEPGLFLPMEAVARRVASSPHASEGLCEGSPVIGTLSKKALGPDVAIGTPVGVTPASRAAALTTLTEAMARATCPDVSLDEREIAIHQAGRVLSSKAVLNLPLALRQEAEVWHSRQEERLNLAKSMEAVVDRASSLEEAAGEAHPADPLRALLSRAMIADKDGPEAVLADWARRASAFEEKLDEQRLRLERRSLPGDQSLLTAADLMELTADLTEMQTKASKELIELQDLRNPRAGEDWKTARNSLESKWMQFVEDSRAAVEETKSALAANRTAKILTSDTEREAALAEAARRQATFQEELQKQRQKLQKRTKAKSAAPTPLELGRLVEDEHLLQALEADRDAAMKECQQFIDAGKAENLGEETSEWTNLLEGWHAFGQDLAKLASHNQDSREAMPNIWAAAAAKAKLGKVDVNHTEQLALLAEGARCAAAFDEELQKQRQQMKRRRKALQKHGGAEQATDVLDACRAISDEEALKELVKEQAEAHAKCQAMACSGEGASEAWEQLAATWAQMEKDIAKAEKEVSEAAKAITNEASSSLVQALGLVQAEVARDVEDGSTQRRAALQEAARRIAVFEEELSKQRAAIRRRRAENPQGASALGCALLDGEAIAALAAKCADGQAACQAAAEEACQGTGEAEHWKDLLQLWDRLRQDLEEDTEQAAVEAKACRAEEASEALAAAGLPAAVRKALDFEHELAKLTHGCHGVSKTCSELQRAQRLASVDRMRVTQASGLAFCQEKVASAGGGQAMPHMVECRDAWQELVGLWQGLGKDLEAAAQELAPTELPSLWRKLLDTSVSEAERQTVLAEAARCAAQFDEELQRQRQRLVRRKKVPMENVADRLLAFGDAIELKALAAEQEAAKSACECKLTEAAAKNNVDEAQTWKEVINVYMALDEVLDATKKEVDVNGSFSARPDVDVGQHMVHSVIRDQKRSAASCLQVVEQAMKKDHGPLEELIEAQQAPSSMKSSGGLTNRSRQGVAQVQTWDVLDAAKGLLDSFKDTSGGTAKNMETLRQLGEEASKQIQQISDSHAPEENIQEKPPMQDFGCQTVFRLGGMAWHADPAIQRLLEDLTKVSLQTMDVADQSHLDKLDLEVTRTFNQWRNEFIGKRRETSLAASRSRSRSGAATEVSAAPESVSAKLHAEVKADHVQEKQVETPALQSSSLKPDEVQLAADSANFSKSPPLESNKVLDDSEIGIRRTKQSSGRRASSPGHLPPSRLTYSESRRPLPGSANSDAEDKPTSRPRRRRSLSRDDSSGVARTDLSLPLGQLPLEPEPRKEEPQHQEPYQETQAEVFQNDDLLVHLERKLSGSQPLSAFSEHHDSKKAVHASTALDGPAGPGDGSLLVPPSLSNVSRSLSPASSIGSSQSPGHVPRRLDPIVRPRGPPLPSAGRLLLASQESPADSAKSSPRSGL